jgi:hypothetical protein
MKTIQLRVQIVGRSDTHEESKWQKNWKILVEKKEHSVQFHTGGWETTGNQRGPKSRTLSNVF